MPANHKKISIGDLLHLRYTPSRKSFANCDPCPAFALFDWVLWTIDVRFPLDRTKPLKKVLCIPHRITLTQLCRIKSLLSDAVLVIAGTDVLLSTTIDLVNQLKPHCRKIYYEAKDVEDPMIESFSMGFISHYLQRTNAPVIEGLMQKAASDTWRKSGVLAAWGAIWPHLDNKIVDRHVASKFVAATPWLKRERLSSEEYWSRLAESQFAICPAGQGVQAPKLAEAWLMRTVPVAISNPCFRDLTNAGYPMLLLDRWSDLSEQLLSDFISKQYKAIEWEQVQQMLTLEYFQNNILNS